MVGAALEGVVESDLEAEVLGGGHEGIEVLDGAEIGVDGVVTADGRSDGPGAARIISARGEGVAGALAMAHPDGVDGREVHHLEAEVGHVGQVLSGVLQPPEGTGEQLVPGGVGGPGSIDPQRHRRGRREAGVGHTVDELYDFVIQCGRQTDLDRAAGPTDSGGGGAEPLLAGGPGHLCGQLVEQDGAFLELELDVLTGLALHLDLVPPRRIPVSPGVDHQLVGADRGRRDRSLPAVVLHEGERRGVPLLVARLPPPHPGADDIVPVGHQQRRDGEVLAAHGLGREP